MQYFIDKINVYFVECLTSFTKFFVDVEMLL